MERTALQTHSHGWLHRLTRASRFSRAPATPRSLELPNIDELALEIAGCVQLDRELPALLKPLEHSLGCHLADKSNLKLGVAVSRQGDGATLFMTEGGPSMPGLETFVRYQLNGALSDIPPMKLFSIPLPGNQLSCHCIRFEMGTGCGWLLLAAPLALPESVERLLAPLAHAIGRGLSIHCLHQKRIDDAVHQERRAHAAELHDSLAQILGYLRLGTSRLDARCSRCNQPDLQAIATDLSHQTRHAYRMLRDLISSSRLTLEGGSLHTALAAAVEEFEQRSALVFELDDRCPQLEPDENIAIQVLMIVREALSNVVRHAHAQHVRIQLMPLNSAGLQLRIEDDGCGLSAERKRGDSFGLGIMQERAEKIGARLEIGPRPEGGTRLDLQVVLLDLKAGD
ncbi:MAG: hypothetical protein CMI01_14550 [Oceanospirillaceae bacterium]|nr:hypothetical protein [Oceanospirillaceae bacterium]